MRRYKAAISERNRQTEAHRGFTESLPSPMVATWEQVCAAWDVDRFPKSSPNPFAVDDTRKSYIPSDFKFTPLTECLIYSRHKRGKR
jgi:hypothetical protein